ncbi:MAG: hypothetical protein JW789_04800 [Candidatus Aenigmarchaeota archaeon]|nr:hypothetical protein [Candidatus Aenigmarchaeota archaeon]
MALPGDALLHGGTRNDLDVAKFLIDRYDDRLPADDRKTLGLEMKYTGLDTL